jgi:uncharacterized protein YbaR (Trm112 family)
VGERVSAPGAISPALQERLRCPACGGRLSPGRSERGDVLRCGGPQCGRVYPVVGGVPVLVDERKSLFDPERIADAMRAAGAPGSTGDGAAGLPGRAARSCTR